MRYAKSVDARGATTTVWGAWTQVDSEEMSLRRCQDRVDQPGLLFRLRFKITRDLEDHRVTCLALRNRIPNFLRLVI